MGMRACPWTGTWVGPISLPKLKITSTSKWTTLWSSSGSRHGTAAAPLSFPYLQFFPFISFVYPDSCNSYCD